MCAHAIGLIIIFISREWRFDNAVFRQHHIFNYTIYNHNYDFINASILPQFKAFGSAF